jgi:hypothetical protein
LLNPGGGGEFVEVDVDELIAELEAILVKARSFEHERVAN